MTDLRVYPAERGLFGSVPVPSDKSIGHRALLLGALATGTSRIQGFTRGGDNLSTLAAVRALGVTVHEEGSSELRIEGASLHGLRAPGHPLDCGNSGTSMRLLAGLLAAQPFASTLVGDASLTKRPMSRVVVPLRLRGATIDGAGHDGSEEVRPPLQIAPPRAGRLGPLAYDLPTPSAQVKSALLLSGLTAEGPTTLSEPIVSRDHTERMLRAMGAPLQTLASHVSIDPTSWDGRLSPLDLAIPGDLSAAAFILVGAQIVPGSQVTVRSVGINPTRAGVLEVLREMGGDVHVEPAGERSGEPVGTLHARFGPLVATRLGGEQVARAIDEVCVVCALAARAEGTTRIEGARELRFKESDRLKMMAGTLQSFGVRCEELEDGLAIRGTQAPLRAATVDSAGDHRVAMTAALLALLGDGPSRVRDVDCIATSFPRFVGTLRALGARVDVEP